MNKKIVIIGAGAAGIATATKLWENGFKNLVILEAENRIGGRINTIPFGQNVVDMGAQWCHGEKYNVVYELGHKYNLLASNTARYDIFSFVQSNGNDLPVAVGNSLMELAIEIVESYKNEMKVYNGSLGSFILEKFSQKLRTDEYKHIDPTLCQQFIDFFHKYENSIEASDTWFDTSCKGYCEYWDCDGDRLLNWKDKGYVSLFDLLMRKIPSTNKVIPIENCVQFNKEVTRINWYHTKEPAVNVKCADGSSYDADHLISTMSLGVLKERHANLFQPSLPSKKINSIEGLTLGTVDKIYLEFDKPFWPKDWQGFSLLWNDDDLSLIRAREDNWIEDVFGFYVVDQQPNILCGWISGVNARRMELQTEADVIESVMYLLRKFLKNKWTIPDPINMKRSTWYSNPHFRGSYTYRSMKTDLLKTTPNELATPITNSTGNPIIQFSGEATHEHYYSTVHGAVESGWREARRIVDLYKMKSQL